MLSNRVTPIEAKDVFELVRRARERQRWVIPLFGSGMSVDTGFPVASHLIDYLVRFAWWRNTQGDDTPAAYLRAHPWPSRHDLHVRWWTRISLKSYGKPGPPCSAFNDSLRQAEINLRHRAMVHELQSRAPTAASMLRAMFQTEGKLDGASSAPSRSVTQNLPDTSYTDYRALLNYLCDGDTTLIDEFFDHFSRNRPPSTTHQHLAFVTRLLNCKLLMTTNFDPFAEHVLRDEGMNPTVYEVTSGGSIPSARLLHRQQLSIVKLHGGAYSLRTGFDLDDVPPAGELAEYASYFRPPTDEPPLLLVMGYSGSDRRVMSIIKTHLQNHWDTSTQGKTALDRLRLVWISRTAYGSWHQVDSLSRPLNGVPDDRVGVCNYRDAGLFLHELYQNLEYQHPVTHSSYHLLKQSPRATDKGTPPMTGVGEFFVKSLYEGNENAFRKEMEGRKAVVFLSEKEGTGTSIQLAKAASMMEKTHVTIWVDAAELRSRAALFTFIEETFHSYDRHLLRMSRPLMYQDVDFLSCEGMTSVNDVLSRIYDWEETVALRWISLAMRRGRYVLAVDSLGEFTLGHQVLEDLDKKKADQLKAGHAFLHKLIHSDYDLGESKVFLAVTNPRPATAPNPAERNVFYKSAHHTPHDPAVVYCELMGDDKVKSREEQATEALTTMLNKGSVEERIKAVIVMIASLCRRPRSLACLTTTMVRAARHLPSFSGAQVKPVVREAFAAVESMVPKSDTTAAALGTISKFIWDLCDTKNGAAAPSPAGNAGSPTHPDAVQLLVHLEGGFFWMHRGVRQAAYVLAKDHFEGYLDELFDCLANFAHADMHTRSNSAATFLEYFFFRLASIRTISWEQGKPIPEPLLTRCTWLVAALELERERLLSWGRLSALLNHIRTLLHWLEVEAPLPGPDGPSAFDALRIRVYGIYADIFLSCGHPQVATAYRYIQSFVLLDGKLRRMNNWTPEEMVTLGRLVTDVDCGVGKVIDTVVTQIDDQLLQLKGKLAEKQELALMRQNLNQYRDLTDLLTNLAVALAEPTLYHTAISNNFWDPNRPARTTILGRIYKMATGHAKILKDELCDVDPTRNSTRTEDFERWSRASIRLFEHGLHLAGSVRFDITSPIARNSPEAGELNRIVDECDSVQSELRAGPNSARRKRHKCYLWLMKARCKVLCGAYQDANVNFERALASLPRAAGAAERTAEALVHLFRAEAKQLEAAWCPKKPDGTTDTQRVITLLKESEAYLALVPSTLNRAGRSENRWRVFLSYLKARLNSERYDAEDQGPAKDEFLFDALRHVVAGLTNTGLRSDRRHVLINLFDKIEEKTKASHVIASTKTDDDEPDLWLKWKLQVGLRSEVDLIDKDIAEALKLYRIP